jgi:signal transduction histidine kinase
MKAWFRLLKARALLLLSVGVTLVGLLPLLYLFGLIGWQFNARFEDGRWVALPAALMFTDHALLQGGKAAPVLAYIPQLLVPQLDWSWTTNEVAAAILGKLHVGLVPALIGCAVMAVGISGVLRQWTLLRIHKERKRDRVRRIDDYRREASRADAGDDRREPFIGAETIPRRTDRRVA